MNEKPDPRSRLIADLFPEDWEKGSAQALAGAAAARVRLRRNLGKTTEPFMLAVGALGALALLILFVRADLHSRAERAMPAVVSVAAPDRAAARHPGYEIISDDELIADLNDRPLLILGNKQTGRQLVVLQN